MQTQAVPQAEGQPARTYRYSVGWRLFLTLGAGVLVPVFAAGALWPCLESTRRGLWWLSPPSALLAVLMMLVAIWACSSSCR